MNKLLKRVSVFLMVTTMVLSAVGCGSKDAAVTDASVSTEAVSTEAPSTEEPSTEAVSTEAPATVEAATDSAAASDEDYQLKVEEIYTTITTTSSEIMASVDQTDAEQTVEAMTLLVTTVKPMYEELAALTAPQTFQDAQLQITTGAEASIELLNISLEMIALEDVSEEEAQAKGAELQEKMLTFQASAQELTTGINTVLGTVAAE